MIKIYKGIMLTTFSSTPVLIISEELPLLVVDVVLLLVLFFPLSKTNFSLKIVSSRFSPLELIVNVLFSLVLIYPSGA